MLVAEKDCSTSTDNKMMENGNCNGIVNLSLQVNNVDVENTKKEAVGKQQQQQIAGPTVETGSSIKSDADATIRSKRKRDRENKVVSVDAP